MSKAMKCDRCGKLYVIDEQNEESRSTFEAGVSGTQPLLGIRLFSHDDSYTSHDYYDLCSDCANSLINWLSDPQETVSKNKIDEAIKVMEKKALDNDREWEQYSDDQNYYVMAVNEFAELLKEACDDSGED